MVLDPLEKSLEAYADSGLFSLTAASSRGVVVELPHFCVWLLTSEFRIFDDDALNPFGYDWHCFELVSMYSLLARMQVQLLLGHKTVTLRQLRPGALASDDTLDKVVRLPDVQRMDGIRRLTDPLPLGAYPYRMGNIGSGKPIDLYDKGGIVQTSFEQTAIDGLVCFPPGADGLSSVVLASQQKSCKSFNPPDGHPSSTTLYKKKVVTILGGMQNALLEEFVRLGRSEEPHIVCELISNIPSKLKGEDVPAGCIVITRDQWAEAVGPVFAQRARLTFPSCS